MNTEELGAIDPLLNVTPHASSPITQELERLDGEETQTRTKETLPFFGLHTSLLRDKSLVSTEAPVKSPSSESQKTGLFEASKPKKHVGLSIALVSAIALIVFITLNPQILRGLFQPGKHSHGPAKITLGTHQLKITYRLTSAPVGEVFDRKTGGVLGETPFEFDPQDERFRDGSLSVRSKGYRPQIIVPSGFMVSDHGSSVRELRILLKPTKGKKLATARSKSETKEVDDLPSNNTFEQKQVTQSKKQAKDKREICQEARGQEARG